MAWKSGAAFGTLSIGTLTILSCFPKPSVTFFGDKLNAINMTGFGIVFLGVILYKIVFHLEKESRMEEVMEEKILMEDTDGGLNDGDDNQDYVNARAVELVDRAQGHHKYQKASMIEEVQAFSITDMDAEATEQSDFLVV